MAGWISPTSTLVCPTSEPNASACRAVTPSSHGWGGSGVYGGAGCRRRVNDVALVEHLRPTRELQGRAVRVLEVHRPDEHVTVVGGHVVLGLVATVEGVGVV